VLDIGANVGAFSVALAQQYRDLRLVLFEPIPATFTLLQRNAARLLTGADVTLVNAGVSAAPGRVTFHVPPESTMATAYPKPRHAAAPGAEKVSLETWVRAGLEDFRRARQIRPGVAAAIGRALEHRLLRPLVLAAILVPVGISVIAGRVRTKQVECELTTISAAMREYDITTVDLVKVDVEGGEWAVLEGIDEADWPHIRQLALEVHDVEDRVARMRELLEGKGFRVVVDDADWATHRLMGVHMLYASRDQQT
jgi:FkbM family methyltransferase